MSEDLKQFISKNKNLFWYTPESKLYSHSFSSTERTITIIGTITLLACQRQQLTDLDVSNSPSLTLLYAYENNLTNLDVRANTNLNNLNCSYNQLNALDVSKNTELESLSCNGNSLSSLNVSTAHTKLVYLGVQDNNMGAAALNAIFQSLPPYTEPGTGDIYIGGNPGFNDCNPALAPTGWTVLDIHL